MAEKIVKVVNVTDAIYEKIKVVEEELKTAKSEYYLLSGKTWNQKIFGGTIHRGFIRVVCFSYGVVFLVRGIVDRYLEIHFNIFSVLIGAGLLYVVYLVFGRKIPKLLILSDISSISQDEDLFDTVFRSPKSAKNGIFDEFPQNLRFLKIGEYH